MSAQVANSEFVFKLPSLSYVDAEWEERDPRVPSASPQGARKRGLAGLVVAPSGCLGRLASQQRSCTELATMSDRQLADIGLSRSDLTRVFDADYNQDLGQRGRYS